MQGPLAGYILFALEAKNRIMRTLSLGKVFYLFRGWGDIRKRMPAVRGSMTGGLMR